MAISAIKNKITYLGESNHYAVYMSIFRVFTSLLLIKQIFNLWPYSSLLFGGQSFYIPPNDVHSLLPINILFVRHYFVIFYGAYMAALFLYLFGVGKNFTALIVFLLFDLVQKLCPMILNGGDNLLKFLLLYMVFADSYQYLSISSKKITSVNGNFYNNFYSNIAGFCVCFQLCLIYFITAIHKIHSDVWFHGIATYYTLQLDRFRGTTWNTLLVKNYFFVTVSTYFTLLVELFYPTLVWFKSTKKFVIIGAILLHIGIYVFMMIYDFQLIFIATQGFFISNRSWEKYLSSFRFQLNKITLWLTQFVARLTPKVIRHSNN